MYKCSKIAGVGQRSGQCAERQTISTETFMEFRSQQRQTKHNWKLGMAYGLCVLTTGSPQEGEWCQEAEAELRVSACARGHDFYP